MIKRSWFMLAALSGALAQPAPPGLTITQAVESALKNYPSIRVSQEQINAAAAGIQLARTAYLPRVDALAQANRATRNTVSEHGMASGQRHRIWRDEHLRRCGAANWQANRVQSGRRGEWTQPAIDSDPVSSLDRCRW